ncbi:MAG: hypothetical protein K6B52_04040 [Clostridiales bacterium]|nr:hypothetical protein [Clostridiales bacterium]
MKKIIAVLSALSLVLALSACGAKTGGEDVTESVTQEAVTENTAEVADVTAVEATEAETTEVETTEPETETTTVEETTEADTSDPSNWTKEQIVDFYNEAVVKTNDAGEINGSNTMKLDGDITGDGALGGVLKIAMPIIKSALERNSTKQTVIPGKGKLKADDVSSAEATLNNGVYTINMKLNSQTDGPAADGEDGGPVARGIGTLGSIENALSELNATILSGRDTIKLRYDNASITAKINQESGKITSGNWHYKVNINVVDAQIKMVVKFIAKNLKGVIDWNIVY